MMMFLSLATALALTVPSDVLARMEVVRQTAARFGQEIWPGWNPGATPFGVYRSGDFIAIAGAKQLPAPFTMYAAGTESSEPIFVAPTSAFPGLQLANTTAKIGDLQIALVSADDLMARATTEEAAAFGMHELFHAYQRKIAPDKQGNILVMLWGEYPEFSARNRVMLQMEGEALCDAISAPTPEETMRHVADFLGYRAERRKELAPELIRYESGEESSEGLASYIEYKLLETAFPQRADLRTKRLDALSYVYKLPNDRERFYVLGMAEAIVLDKVRPGWKREYESSDLMVDGVLAKVTTPTPATRQWGPLIEQEQKQIAELESAGSRRIGMMLAKGRKVVVEVANAKHKLQLRGINPNMIVQLTPNHTAFTYLLLDLDDMKLEFTGVPVIYEKQQDAFWCMLPPDVVDKALENMGDKLTIAGRGFKMEFQYYEVDRRGNEVRIRPAAAPEKKAPTKPEFVKPVKPGV